MMPGEVFPVLKVQYLSGVGSEAIPKCVAALFFFGFFFLVFPRFNPIAAFNRVGTATTMFCMEVSHTVPANSSQHTINISLWMTERYERLSFMRRSLSVPLTTFVGFCFVFGLLLLPEKPRSAYKVFLFRAFQRSKLVARNIGGRVNNPAAHRLLRNFVYHGATFMLYTARKTVGVSALCQHFFVLRTI
jgi:hypothetical protein